MAGSGPALLLLLLLFVIVCVATAGLDLTPGPSRLRRQADNFLHSAVGSTTSAASSFGAGSQSGSGSGAGAENDFASERGKDTTTDSVSTNMTIAATDTGAWNRSDKCNATVSSPLFQIASGNKTACMPCVLGGLLRCSVEHGCMGLDLGRYSMLCAADACSATFHACNSGPY